MSRKRGFTLVELLVVIAIIALLMSILMPALGRVRKQAKLVLCQSNLKQWGIIFSMYTNDHDDYFHEGWCMGGGPVRHWMSVLRPYYSNELKLLFCSMATKPRSEGGSGVTSAWGIFPEGDFGWTNSGSYGINSWLCNPPEEQEPYGPPERYWRTINVKNVVNTPMFLDAWWFDGWPKFRDPPLELEDTYISGNSFEDMRDFCVNRHDGYVDCLFMDFSVRKVSLKCLWTLKWHRTFDTEGEWTIAGGVEPEDWPAWMKNIKDECE